VQFPLQQLLLFLNCRYWHSHAYEVTCGQLIASNVPTVAENVDLAKVGPSLFSQAIKDVDLPAIVIISGMRALSPPLQ
jgi:hypothetical protein